MADHAAKIKELENLLASGLLEYSVDGQTTKFQSRQDLVRELNRLKAEDDASVAAGTNRKTLTRFNLGDAW